MNPTTVSERKRFMETWASWRVAALLMATYAASRLLLFASGLKFDDSFLDNGWQQLDPDLLRHRLLESLLYMHSQPPAFNAFLGMVLKVAGSGAPVAFHASFLAMGAALYGVLYLAIRALLVPRAVAFVASTIFAVSPSYVLYENWLFYTMPLALLVGLAALSFARLLDRKDGASCALFFGVLGVLCVTHALFHLVFLAGAIVGVATIRILRVRTVLAAAALPLLVVTGIYAKNAVIFGRFTESTWFGMNLAVHRVDALPRAEMERLVSSGLLSDVALLRPFQELEDYPAHYNQVPPRLAGIPVLAAAHKSNGQPNLNHIAYIEIASRYAADSKYIIAHYPSVAISSVARGWYEYFRSSSQYWFLDPGLASSRLVRTERDVFDLILYGVLPRGRVGIFLVLGIPALVVYAARLALRRDDAHAGSTTPEQRLILVFCAVIVAFVAVVGNTLNAQENMRLRFMTDPLVVILAAYWVAFWLLPRVRRRSDALVPQNS
jgi:hypothetical protein